MLALLEVLNFPVDRFPMHALWLKSPKFVVAKYPKKVPVTDPKMLLPDGHHCPTLRYSAASFSVRTRLSQL